MLTAILIGAVFIILALFSELRSLDKRLDELQSDIANVDDSVKEIADHFKINEIK